MRKRFQSTNGAPAVDTRPDLPRPDTNLSNAVREALPELSALASQVHETTEAFNAAIDQAAASIAEPFRKMREAEALASAAGLIVGPDFGFGCQDPTETLRHLKVTPRVSIQAHL